MTITKQELDNLTEEVFKDMFDVGAKKEAILEIQETFNKNKDESTIFSDKVIYCINNFVTAELDYKTSGDRGLGRTSSYWPRLGSFFRKNFIGFNSKEIEEVDFVLTKLIAKSYLLHLILLRGTLKDPKRITTSAKLNTSQFYERWVPQIYVTDLSSFHDFMHRFTDREIEKAKLFLKKRKMTPGFFTTDKTSEILGGYIQAGATLWATAFLTD